MYVPDHFRVDDLSRMHALMRARPLAALVSAGRAGLYATHLPTVLKDDAPCGLIECHLARANPHWKELAGSGEVLMIFQGPEGYVTPNWYPSKAEHGKVVPTWNYAAVHAYGRPELIEDASWLRRHVAELTDQQERGEAEPDQAKPGQAKPDQAKPWALSDAPESFVTAMLRGIVGIRFAILRLEGKWKMSQNRGADDRAGVVSGLARRGKGDDLELSDLVMRLTSPRAAE